MTRYIDEHRGSYGVEPICRTLAIAPSTYYAAKARPPSARHGSDATLADVMARIHRENFGVYGVPKKWKALHRAGIEAGRDQVARVMGLVGLEGATRVGASLFLEPLDGRDTSLMWVLTTGAVVFEASQLRVVPTNRRLTWIAFAGLVLAVVMVTGVPPWP